MKYTPKILGKVSVDSGLIWIGDPCYILQGKRPSALGKTWDHFCSFIKKSFKAFKHDGKKEGLGVCTSTKYGDGMYNVIGYFTEGSNRPSFVIVDFENVIKI